MTDIKIIKHAELMWVKAGDIEVKNIYPSGEYTLVVPVFCGELGIKKIATFDLEFINYGEDIGLLNFPKKLLTEEDYGHVIEKIAYSVFDGEWA